ncbi:hypothetical protein [Promicromonospora sukumoe]
MSTHALEHAPAATDLDDRPRGGRDSSRPGAAASAETAPREAAGTTRRGLLGLLALGVALVAAAGLLGARTWQVGSGLGAAFFPVEDIVELAAVAVGTATAGWTGAHALLALACVLADRRGRRWAAAERTVARSAPAIVLRLARVAAGAGLGLALATPTAMALPHGPAVPAADGGPAVVLDLGWRPTSGSNGSSGESTESGERAGREPATARSSLVARSSHPDERTVMVEAGDTLWSIAADGLARDAAARAGTHTVTAADPPTDAEIVDAVGRWHQANRDVLGADPDLIRPGTVLRAP